MPGTMFFFFLSNATIIIICYDIDTTLQPNVRYSFKFYYIRLGLGLAAS